MDDDFTTSSLEVAASGEPALCVQVDITIVQINVHKCTMSKKTLSLAITSPNASSSYTEITK